MSKQNIFKLPSKYVPYNISIIDRYKIINKPYVILFIKSLSLIPNDESIFDIGYGNGTSLKPIYQTKSAVKIGCLKIWKRLVDHTNEFLNKAINSRRAVHLKININNVME